MLALRYGESHFLYHFHQQGSGGGPWRLALPLLIHAEMNHTVQDLPPVVEAAGLADMTSGDTRVSFLGFVAARVPA